MLRLPIHLAVHPPPLNIAVISSFALPLRSELPIRPHDTLNLGRIPHQARPPLDILTCHSLPILPLLRARPRHLARIEPTTLLNTRPQRPQQLHRRLRRQILIVIIIDLHHRRVHTRTQALDLQQTKHPIFSHVARMDPQLLLNGLHDLVAAAAAQHARRGGAHLHEECAHGLAVVHGVKGRDLVDAHRRHFEESCDFVHDANRGEAVLSLAEVEEGHDGGFFVLWWVSLEDFGDEFVVDFVELEGDRGVVVWGVAVLCRVKNCQYGVRL